MAACFRRRGSSPHPSSSTTIESPEACRPTAMRRRLPAACSPRGAPRGTRIPWSIGVSHHVEEGIDQALEQAAIDADVVPDDLERRPACRACGTARPRRAVSLCVATLERDQAHVDEPVVGAAREAGARRPASLASGEPAVVSPSPESMRPIEVISSRTSSMRASRRSALTRSDAFAPWGATLLGRRLGRERA